MQARVHYEWINQRWLPQTNGTSGAWTLVSWLDSDINFCESTIDRFLEKMDRAAEDKVVNPSVDLSPGIEMVDDPFYLGTGNSMSSWANNHYFYLECLYAEELKVIMTLEQVRDALAQYRHVSERGWNDPDHQPKAFDCNYLAEGMEATLLAIEFGLISFDSDQGSARLIN